LRGHFYELRLWLRRLLLRPTPPTVARASLLGCAALLVAGDKDFAGAQELLKETLAIWRQLGDPKGIAGTLNGLAELMSNPDIAGLACDPGAARALAEESLAMMRELDDKQGMAHSLFLLGRLARQVGENDQARSAWVECRALDEELGVQGGYVLAALGGLVLESGEAGTARHYYATFLTERHKIGDRERVVWGLQGLSAVALAQGEAERAARLLGAVVAVYDNLASSPPEQERNQYEALRSALREKLGEAACEAAWVEGYALTYEEAVRFALSGGRA